MFRFHTASHHHQHQITRKLLTATATQLSSSCCCCCTSHHPPQHQQNKQTRSSVSTSSSTLKSSSSSNKTILINNINTTTAPTISPQLQIQQRNQVGLATGNPSMEKHFQCSVCQKTFRLAATVTVHIKNVHAGEGKILDMANGGAVVSEAAATASAQSNPQQQQQQQNTMNMMRSASFGGFQNPSSPPIQPVQPVQQQQQQQQQQTSTSTQQQQQQQQQQQRTSRFSTVATSSSRGGAFPTLNPNASGNSMMDSRSETEDRFKREIRRGKSIKDPIYKPTVEMAQEFMDEMMEVWDKYGVMRLKEKYFKYSDREKAYAAKKMIEDETIPTYETAMDDASGSKSNPFAELESVDDVAATTKKTVVETPATTKTATSTGTGTTEKEPQTLTTISEIVYAIGPKENVSPFICASIENPLVTYPQPPEKPQVKRQRSAGSSSSSRLQSSTNDDDDSSMMNNENDMMMGSSSGSTGMTDEDESSSSSMMSQHHQDASFDANEASPFAQAMQATSPFSISEQSAPIDIQSQQQQQQQQVASPFAQAASSSSPFGSFDPSTSSASSSSQQQVQSPFAQQMMQQNTSAHHQQQQQQQQQIISPFADLMTPTQQQQVMMQQQQQQQQQASTTQTYQASSTGAPLTPIEAAVDLSALFGAQTYSSQQQYTSSQQQQQEMFMCKICGKNTFKSEYALITHCQEKHGIDVAADLMKNKNQQLEAGLSPTGRKKVRQLPDLPPYIPTPVDLAATSPYGSTRQRGTTTAFWSEVEVAPHARMMSSITLLGEVEKIIKFSSSSSDEEDNNHNHNHDKNVDENNKNSMISTVLGKPCLQFSLHIHESEHTEEEKFVVRCFGDDLIRHLNENVKLEEGSSVFVEGLLKLNPSYDARLKRYQANPAVHVALPNGFVQRLD